LTDEEAREWRGYLSGVRKLAASTVNVRLAALKGLVRHAGGRIETRGVRRVEQPVETLTARELGRLVLLHRSDATRPDRQRCCLGCSIVMFVLPSRFSVI